MGIRFTIEKIAEIVGGTLVRGKPLTVVSHVATDSRRPFADGTIFFALKGSHFDGHHFLVDAASRGAIAVVVDRDHVEVPRIKNVIAVDDTLHAMQALAAAHRARFGGAVVGITGSNGKTIVKEMLAAIVGRERTVGRSPGSFNSQVGVPHSVFGLRPEQEVALVEAGVSQPGEMERLQRVIMPDIGIITNIGEAHLAGFGDLEVTATEKLKLFAEMHGALIWNADDSVLRGRLANLDGLELYGFGEAYDASYRIVKTVADDVGFDLVIRMPEGERLELRLDVPGRHNLWNAAAAVAVAHQLGISAAAIQQGLQEFREAPMRLEMHTTGAGVTLINDAYSSDPVSAAAAFHALIHYAAGARTVAIIGDMLDLGEASEQTHVELGRLAAQLDIGHLVCVGPLARIAGRAAVSDGLPYSRVTEVSEDEEHDLAGVLDPLVRPGDFVLLKASRAIGLERAAQSLLESMAPTRLYVDLAAIRENVQTTSRALGTNTGLMAVIKSFAYGNDSNRVALTLADAGVDAFMVAFPDEAIPLRRRGITLPILVSNVRPDEVDKVVKYDLTALIADERTLESLQREATRRNREVAVHVEIETGMNRLGVSPRAALAFCRRIQDSPHLRFDGLMTHFAVADDVREDAFTQQQIATFESVVAELAHADVVPRVVHAANTAAAWRFPQARFDMVRIGLGLYGIMPSADVSAASRGLRTALEFVTEVIAVHEVEAGESVGYGRRYRAPSRRVIATIAAGYNDGLPRFMSSGGEVLVGGRRCSVVGSVCMDVSMVDVTDVTPAVAAGDEVVIFGTRGEESITVEEIALRGDTISYEILTNISPRARRVFLR